VSQTIQISEKSAALLARQAASLGKTLEAWIEELALEKAQIESDAIRDLKTSEHQRHIAPDPSKRSVVEHMRELRSQVKPDPEGWTVKDYIDYGRR